MKTLVIVAVSLSYLLFFKYPLLLRDKYVLESNNTYYNIKNGENQFHSFYVTNPINRRTNTILY